MAAMLPVLICGAMMVGCVVMMARMHGGHHETPDHADADEVARLREEVVRLRLEHKRRLPSR